MIVNKEVPLLTPLEFKLWRVGQGLTQAQCAERFHVSQAAVSYWERHGLPDHVEAAMEASRARHEAIQPLCRFSDTPETAPCRGKGYCPRDPACNE